MEYGNYKYNTRVFQILDIKFNKTWNQYSVYLVNNQYDTHFDFVFTLWNTLNTIKEWKETKKKVMMVCLYIPEKNIHFYIQSNMAITENTTVYDYNNKVKNAFQAFWESNSIHDPNDYRYIIVEFMPIEQNNKSYSKLRSSSPNLPNIKNIDRKFYSTSTKSSLTTSNGNGNGTIESKLKNQNKWLIKPIKNKMNKDVNSILCALDIETIKLNNDTQIPIAISFAYLTKSGEFKSFITLIDHKLLISNEKEAVLNMWSNFYKRLKGLNLSSKLIIYSHNLGAFDGYFITQSLFNYEKDFNNIQILIDNANNFITINYKYSTQPYLNLCEEELAEKGFFNENANLLKDNFHWVFLDSCRVFPISLNELTKIFDVEGKKGKYNLDWNNIKVFENPIELNNFIQYSIQDSVSLLKAINKARNYYFDEYKVDLIKAVSTSSLSLLIYRTKFQKIDIPILKRNLDTKIRISRNIH